MEARPPYVRNVIPNQARGPGRPVNDQRSAPEHDALAGASTRAFFLVVDVAARTRRAVRAFEDWVLARAQARA